MQQTALFYLDCAKDFEFFMNKNTLLNEIRTEYPRDKAFDKLASRRHDIASEMDVTKNFEENWDKIELERFDQYPDLFSSSTFEDLPYLLGAYMYQSAKLESFKSSAFDNICPHPVLMSNKKYRKRPKLLHLRNSLSSPQLSVFIKYLEFRMDYIDSYEASILVLMKDIIEAE